MKKTIKKTTKIVCNFINSTYFFPILAVAFFCLMESNLYAGNGTDLKQLEALSDSTANIVLGSWFKKLLLTFGGGTGLIKSFSAGSVKPLLVFGGIGILASQMVSFINFLSNLCF